MAANAIEPSQSMMNIVGMVISRGRVLNAEFTLGYMGQRVLRDHSKQNSGQTILIMRRYAIEDS
jgi:hypothetical protein